MISRRTLLASSALFGSSALAGCGLIDPHPNWPFGSTPVALPGADDGAAACRRLANVLDRALGQQPALAFSPAHLDHLQWLTTANRWHLNALSGRDPLTRPTDSPSANTSPKVASPSADPEPRVPFTDVAGALAAVSATLTANASAHRGRSLAATGLACLLWAGLAAFSQIAAERLATAPGAGASDGNHLVPASSSPAEAGVRVLSRLHELVYGFEVTAATPALPAATRNRFLARQSAWRRLRDDLIARLAGAGGSPPQPSAAYRLGVPANEATALVQAARLDSAAVTHLGSFLVSAGDTGLVTSVVDALVAAHSSAVSFGAPQLRWPGWPMASA